MDNQYAQERLAYLRGASLVDSEGMTQPVWRDSRHIATTTLSRRAERDLTPPGEESAYALVEIWLVAPMPLLNDFEGILAVDDRGVWWYDGDGHIEDPVWRPTLLPWSQIQALRLHQVS